MEEITLGPRSPDSPHVWLCVPQVSSLVGSTRNGKRQRILRLIGYLYQLSLYTLVPAEISADTHTSDLV